MVFPIVGGTQDTGYEVANSVRLNDGDNPKLTFTPSSAVTSERRTFTISWWVKRGADFGTTGFMWEMGGNDNANERIIARFDGNNRLNVNDSSTAFRIPNRLFRDPSAWYHLVVAFDTTDGTADNRVKVYVNGVQETSFLTSNNPGQNDTKGFSHNSEHTIARTNIDNGFSFDGYMTEFHAVGGSQLDATSFGEFNDNGVWIPKKYTGSHGTNGFFLEFQQTGTSQNSSGIGADTSGNDNHFAVANLAALDVTTDTCTNNFCTLNPLDSKSGDTYSEGNTAISTVDSGDSPSRSTFSLTGGKWYWEVKRTSAGSPDLAIGVMEQSEAFNNLIGSTAKGYGYYSANGNKYNNDSNSSYGNSFGDGDIIGIALDMDNGVIWFSKNGTWQNSATQSEIENGTTTNSAFTGISGTISPAISDGGSGSSTAEFNFGNAPFSISSGNSDANGYGNFEYAVPSGYYSLNTKNLAEYG